MVSTLDLSGSHISWLLVVDDSVALMDIVWGAEWRYYVL